MSNVTSKVVHSRAMRAFLRITGKIVVAWVAVAGCIMVTLLVLGAIRLAGLHAAPNPLQGLAVTQGSSASGNELLALKVQGLIVGDADTPETAALAGADVSGYGIKRQLYAAADHPEIKGVMLEIDSPGGTIYGARAIADGVKYYRDKTGKPVYAHIEGTGASGAYWAAASATQILADYGSDIGSIGVVIGPFQYYDTVLSQSDGTSEIVTQKGIQSVEVTAGTSKDLGNPFRKLTAAELASLQTEVNHDYSDFVSYVSSQRKISRDMITNQIGAMIYGNQTAQSDKLIDGSASREDAFDQLASVAGVSGGDYSVVELPAPARSGISLTGALGNLLSAPKVTAGTGAGTDCQLTRTTLAYAGDTTQLCQK